MSGFVGGPMIVLQHHNLFESPCNLAEVARWEYLSWRALELVGIAHLAVIVAALLAVVSRRHEAFLQVGIGNVSNHFELMF
jgi:hypothetical protein